MNRRKWPFAHQITRGMFYALSRFTAEERGEATPLSYLLALMFSLFFILFAFDLGIRKGTRLAVEYAAFCAARTAAVRIPIGDENKSGACLDDATQEMVHAASACLTSVASKQNIDMSDRDVFWLPGLLNPVDRLISRLRGHVSVTVREKGAAKGSSAQCFPHNAMLEVEVQYTDRSSIPLSPLSWINGGPLIYKATAPAMLHSVR